MQKSVVFGALRLKNEFYFKIGIEFEGARQKTYVEVLLQELGFQEEVIKLPRETARDIPADSMMDHQFFYLHVKKADENVKRVWSLLKALSSSDKRNPLQKEEWEDWVSYSRINYSTFEILLRCVMDEELYMKGEDAFYIIEKLYLMTPGGCEACQGLIDRMLVGGSGGGVMVNASQSSSEKGSWLSYRNRVLKVKVPDNLSSAKGKMIGKAGKNIKFLKSFFHKINITFVLK